MTTLHVFESDSVRRDVYVLCGRTVINSMHPRHKEWPEYMSMREQRSAGD